MTQENQSIKLSDIENIINYSRQLEDDLEFKHKTLLDLDEYLTSISTSIPNSTSNKADMNKLIQNQNKIKSKTNNNRQKINKSLKNLEITLKNCKSNENIVVNTPITNGIRKKNPYSNRNTNRRNKKKNKSRKKIKLIRK